MPFEKYKSNHLDQLLFSVSTRLQILTEGPFETNPLFCPGVQQPAKGYKEEGPPDIIQVELSKLSYIHSTGEVENSKLGRQQKESTPNMN